MTHSGFSERTILQQEMAFQDVNLFSIPDLSLVTFDYFGLFIHSPVPFGLAYSIKNPQRTDCLLATIFFSRG